ncbi:hypothetical protein [Streptomyces sp. bgisy153]|uniref:hypothetical protein n=1 Tax=Streptomyces sp. bgisy153 TaxID=3413793 RepID=UPI003D764F54
MLAHIDPAQLTPAQLDGIACLVCAVEDGPMVPVGVVNGCQVFAHRVCVDRPAHAGMILVVGSTTPDDYADVRAFAADVADRLRFPAVVAVGRDYDPTEYEGVVLADGWERSPASAGLGAEALLSDVCCLTARDVYEHPVNTVCGHCGERDPEAAPVWLDERWTTSVCPGCASVHGVGGLLVALEASA